VLGEVSAVFSRHGLVHAALEGDLLHHRLVPFDVRRFDDTVDFSEPTGKRLGIELDFLVNGEQALLEVVTDVAGHFESLEITRDGEFPVPVGATCRILELVGTQYLVPGKLRWSGHESLEKIVTLGVVDVPLVDVFHDTGKGELEGIFEAMCPRID